MSQDELLLHFKKNRGKWLTTGYLVEKTGLGYSNVSRGIRGLFLRGYLCRKYLQPNKPIYRCRANVK